MEDVKVLKFGNLLISYKENVHVSKIQYMLVDGTFLREPVDDQYAYRLACKIADDLLTKETIVIDETEVDTSLIVCAFIL